MALLDRLLPAWRHSDPAVRAEAVSELDDADTLAGIARNDSDAAVRLAAAKQLSDIRVLREVAGADADEGVRQAAAARAADLSLRIAVSDGDVAACAEALAALERPSHRVSVAIQAAHADIRRQALSGLSGEEELAQVARRSVDPEIGVAAVERVEDVGLLRRVAAGKAPGPVALAALERIHDPDVLQGLADDKMAQAAVRKRARSMLTRVMPDDHPMRVAQREARRAKLCIEIEALHEERDTATARKALAGAESEWRDLARVDDAAADVERRFRRACDAIAEKIARAERRAAEEKKADVAHQRELARREELCATVDSLDGANAPEVLKRLQKEWQVLGTSDHPRGSELATRFAHAVERCERRFERWQARDEFHGKLVALVKEAEALVVPNKPRAAQRPRAALERRWQRLASSSSGAKWMAEERELQERFDAAGAALQRQESALVARREQRAQSARDQIVELCERLAAMAKSDGVKLADVDPAMQEANQAAKRIGNVPADERQALRERLEAAQQGLAQRFGEQSREEEWKRWANADAQRKIIDEARALLEAGDLRAMLRDFGRLERDWKRFAVAPREQSQKLWNEYREARDELRKRTDAYLADNLKKKQALCEQAEALGDSTQWNATADAFRKLQAEWKATGPLRKREGDALFERFRAPANAFFERRKAYFDERDERQSGVLAEMQALVDIAEEQAASKDWDTAAAEIKRVQTEWRKLSPYRDKRANELWERFKSAGDRFFDRFRRRDEIEAEERFALAESVFKELESLAGEVGQGERDAGAVGERLAHCLGEWAEKRAVGSDAGRALETRFQEICDQIENALPDGLARDDVDAGSKVDQREKLCKKLERLTADLPEALEAPTPEDVAARLKLAMAANTIGGSAALPHEKAFEDAEKKAEKLEDRWSRLGPYAGKSARDLAERFATAKAAFVSELAARWPR